MALSSRHRTPSSGVTNLSQSTIGGAAATTVTAKSVSVGGVPAGAMPGYKVPVPVDKPANPLRLYTPEDPASTEVFERRYGHIVNVSQRWVGR